MLLNRREMITTSALLAAGLVAGCGRKSNTVLRLGTIPWRAYEPLFFAREQGYFTANLQIVEYPGTPEIHRSFQNHAVEAATVTLDEALLIAQMQPEVRVINAVSFSNGADALLAKPGIDSLADLKGKRIGVELNATGSFVLSRILERSGLKRTDVTIVPVSPTSTEAAFAADQFDAVIAYEPFAGRLRATGATVLFDSTQIPGEIVDVLIVRKSTLVDQEGALVNLLSGWFRAVDVFGQKRSGSGTNQVISPEFAETLGRMELLNQARNLALMGTAEGALARTVRKLGASMKKYGLLKEMIDPAILLDATILKQMTP